MLRQIAPQYIDTGKAKVVYHHFASIGPESTWAAEAANCAGEQNKFWEYTWLVFDNQAGENQGAFSRAHLKEFAARLTLDATAFNTCFDSDKYQTAIQQEKTQGLGLGVQATPTFFINGQKYEGALSASQMTRLIDSLQ